MLNTSNKYYYSFKIGIQRAIEYRTDFILSIISAFLPIIIHYFVWNAVFSNSQSPTINGYNFEEMITYIILANVIARLISAGFEHDIADDIRSGRLANYYIKPIGYFSYRFFNYMGQKVIHIILSIIILVLSLVFLTIYFNFTFTYDRMLFFLISLISSTVLNFMLFFSLSAIAFWSTEVWGIFIGANLSILIVSGGILPLDMFGATFMRATDFLPFKYTIYYPINILNGNLNYSEILFGMGIQLVWIVVFIFVVKLLWFFGMRKFISVGG